MTAEVTKTAVLLGVGMSVKKILAAIVVIAVLTATLLVTTRSDHTEIAERTGNGDQTSGIKSAPPTQGEEDPASSEGVDPKPRIHEPVLAKETANELLKGIVRAGNGGAPISDASIRLFEPRRTTIHELLREPDSDIRQNQWGQIRPRSWVRLNGQMSTEQRMGLEPFAIYNTFKPADEEFSHTTSGSEGSFEIPCPESGGIVVVTAEGYGASTLIVLGHDEQVVVELWPVGRITGFIIDPEGNRVHDPLKLMFSGKGAKPVIVESGEDGSFSVEIAAKSASAECLTPGWSLTNTGIHPERGDRWVFRTSFSPASEEVAILVAQPVPVLSVSDAKGGAVEDFHLLVQRVPQGRIHVHGRFVTPDGELTLDPPPFPSGPTVLRVWAEGYAPHESELPEFPWEGVLEVVLWKGQVPSVIGRVWDESGAVPDARVSLAAYREIAWNEQEGAVVALTRTDERGQFELMAPTGYYLLQVQRADDVIYRVVRSPSMQAVSIDFAKPAAISVSVRDSNGSPLIDHAVGLHGPDGRSTVRYTDNGGIARFEHLTPGEYTVTAPHVSTKGSFAGDVVKRIQLTQEQDEVATILDIPAREEPIYPRVVTNTHVDYSGWKARDAKWPGDHIGLNRDGSIPLDVQLGVRSFEIEDPKGRRWDVRVPSTIPRPYEISIPIDGVRYRGVLSQSARPKSGVRILASPRGEGQQHVPQPSVVTDERGEFEIICSSDTPHSLTFNDDEDTFTWNNYRSRLASIRYELSDPPITTPRVIDVDLGKCLDSGRILNLSGNVKRNSGAGLARARLYFEARFPQRDGTLVVRAQATANDDGHYKVKIIDAPHYRTRIYEPEESKPILEDEWENSGWVEEGQRDFRVGT